MSSILLRRRGPAESDLLAVKQGIAKTTNAGREARHLCALLRGPRWLPPPSDVGLSEVKGDPVHGQQTNTKPAKGSPRGIRISEWKGLLRAYWIGSIIASPATLECSPKCL